MVQVDQTKEYNIDFIEYFKDLEDPRLINKSLYPLPEILLLVLCATLSGANDWVAIALYGKEKREFLQKFLPFENGTPSHDQLGTVFSALDAEQFQSCFAGWVSALQQTIKGVVALDGKVLRRSFDKAGKKGAINMVSAWCSAQNLVLAQTAVDKKSNEITAIPKLLDLLEIKGAIITIDAMGCQRKIAEKIKDKQADYILAMKKNQAGLYHKITGFFKNIKQAEKNGFTIDYHETTETSHGRRERRRVSVCSDLDWLQRRHKWPGLASIIMVEYHSEDWNGKTRNETRFYISSLVEKAEFMAGAIRDHWGVENGLHWVMDMLFRDDECRIRKGNAPANFTTIKHAASNILRQAGGGISMRQKRHKAAWSETYLLEILTS